MKSAKQFLRQVDDSTFEKLMFESKQHIVNTKSTEEIATIVESMNIETYKRSALIEYIDKNKDKLLAMDTYTEGDPVIASDDFEPAARKHGKVISRGAKEGTYTVRFEDGEYDVPEHHLSRKDAVATEAAKDTREHGGEKRKIHKMITEMKCLALLEDYSLIKVIIESFDTALSDIATQVNQEVLAVFPEKLSTAMTTNLAESEMTDAQKARREDIVMGLKKNKEDLKQRYGDKWESVMYAIATKQAMGESLIESSGDVIFKQKSGDRTVTISKVDDKFHVKCTDSNGETVCDQEFDDIKEAEKAAQEYL